jgi:flagellar motility protein MotE (MotC chaperone)
MKSMPRFLPLVGVAVGGVLALNFLAGARDLPSLLSSASAFAEEAAKPVKGKADKAAKADPKAAVPAVPGVAPTGDASNTAATGPLPPPTIKPPAVCAPTAAELAKEAGLSPAELQVLQNLGERRGELDKREEGLSTQLALLSAAEAKLDAKVKTLTGLKADVQGLLDQANGREAAETDRLVKVFEGMKPQLAAQRMTLLDDSVRLPIAAKMKERSLSAVLAQMPPADAKKLTESLAHRFTAAQTLAANASAQADQAAAKTAAPADATATPAKAPAKGKPKPKRVAKAPPRKTAPANAQAAADAPAAPADKTAAPAAAAPAPAKAG